MTTPDPNWHQQWADHLRTCGADDIEIAATWIEAEVEIAAVRAVKPTAYPLVTRPMDAPATAHRIVGVLLEQGWTPPQPIEVPDHA